MLSMLFSNILNAEIVDNESEADWSCSVFPETRGVDDFIVAVFGEVLFQQFVGQYTGLGEAIHGARNFHINASVFDFITEEILVNDVVREDLDWNPHVFITV